MLYVATFLVGGAAGFASAILIGGLLELAKRGTEEDRCEECRDDWEDTCNQMLRAGRWTLQPDERGVLLDVILDPRRVN